MSLSFLFPFCFLLDEAGCQDHEPQFSFITAVPKLNKDESPTVLFFGTSLLWLPHALFLKEIFFILTRGKIKNLPLCHQQQKTTFSALLSPSQRAVSGWAHVVRGWELCQSQGRHVSGVAAAVWCSLSTEGLEKRCLWQLHSENKLSSEIFIVCHNFKVFLYIISYLIVSTTLGYLYLLVCRVEHWGSEEASGAREDGKYV